MNLLQSMVIAFSMYSKIPMPRVDWNEKNMKYAMCFFPLVGGIEGILMLLAGRLLMESGFGKIFVAAVMTLLPILITGGIHMDGFMDTMDALSSYGDREKKLAILKDSHAGAFAILGVGCYLVWNVALWTEVKEQMLPVIVCGYVLSRACSGYSVVTFPSARDSGLAKTFQDGAHRQRVRIVMLLWMAAISVGMLWMQPVSGSVEILCALVIFLYYRHICRKQFGGMTGDLAGYFLQLCELAMLTGVVLVGRFF